MSWLIDDVKRRHFIMALLKTKGNLDQTARLIGMESKSTRNLVKKHGLEKFLAVLRFADAQGKSGSNKILEKYERRSAEVEEAVSRSLTLVNATMDVDKLLGEILVIQAQYAEDLDGPMERWRSRNVYKSGHATELKG